MGTRAGVKQHTVRGPGSGRAEPFRLSQPASQHLVLESRSRAHALYRWGPVVSGLDRVQASERRQGRLAFSLPTHPAPFVPAAGARLGFNQSSPGEWATGELAPKSGDFTELSNAFGCSRSPFCVQGARRTPLFLPLRVPP
jgi:hypothetical protein